MTCGDVDPFTKTFCCTDEVNKLQRLQDRENGAVMIRMHNMLSATWGAHAEI